VIQTKETTMISLSAGAVSEIKRLILKENKTDVGLRIGVRAGGCSGMSYMLGFDTAHADDKVEEHEGIKVLVDPESAGYLTGIELDYVDGLQGKGFTFKNPNATRSCGCGESFSV
jgi:iron-sulfur cluster assembly accessory protein